MNRRNGSRKRCGKRRVGRLSGAGAGAGAGDASRGGHAGERQADGGTERREGQAQARAYVGNGLRHGKPLPLGTHSLQYMNSTSCFPASARLAECISFRRLLSTRFAPLCFFLLFLLACVLLRAHHARLCLPILCVPSYSLSPFAHPIS